MKTYLVLISLILQVTKPGATTYNSVFQNVQSAVVQNTQDNTAGLQACSSQYGTWVLTSNLQKLYDGQVNIGNRYSECICGQYQWSNRNIYFKLTFTNIVAAGTKTIILTVTHDTSSTLTSVELAISSDGSTYTTICTACRLGPNDFSSANSNTGLAAFQYLKVTWSYQKNLALCEVWIYPYTNYVPLSTITGYRSQSSSGAASVVFSKYATSANTYCIDYNSWSFTTSSSQTCIYDDNTSSFAFMVIDFPSPMIFKEFQVSGGASYDNLVYLIDPRSSLMQKDAQALVQAALSISNKDFTKFVSYQSPTGEVHQAYKAKKIDSISCSIAECSTYAATRIIVANDYTKNFFICGIAVMAEKMPCPPTYDQCLHSVIKPTAIDSTMSITTLSTVSSSTFIFDDNLSLHCGTSNVCGFTQTFTLNCIDCTTCSAQSACGGTCGAWSAPLFSYQFVADTGGYKLQVTDDDVQTIQHKCYIVATANGQTVSSSNTMLLKKTCDLCSRTTYVTTSVPNFPTAIPIGPTGMTAAFSAFTDSVTLCGSNCGDSSYSVICRLATDTTGAFVPILSSWLWSGAISGAGSTLSFYANSLSESNHQKTYTCKINGYQPLANIFMDSTQTFDVTFDLCLNATRSCTLDYWIPITSAWVQPSSFTVYLDGIAQTTSFFYTNWQDKFGKICGAGYCGTLSYTFIDTKTGLPLDIPDATIITTIDTVTQEVTLSVATSSSASSGTYTVQARGSLNNAGIWTGTPPTSMSSTFTITVVNPCSYSNPCQYTRVLDSTQVLTSMSIYLDNVAVLQQYDLMLDYISGLCNLTCGSQTYSLVFSANNSAVPVDLALLKTLSGVPYIQAATTNYLYTGTHNVMIKCLQYGTYGYSLPFDINVVACNTRSCYSTLLTAPVAPAVLPASYSIGVDNVAGQTYCALFKNTVGTACTSNPLICGSISYQLIYASTGLTPSFTTLATVGSQLVQTAQTTDITLNGAHVVKIKATLDLTTLGLGFSAQTATTSSYTITVDYCAPLPCNYNSLILPSSGLPSDLYVYTNGTEAKTTFPSYKDVVSQRCSSPYVNKCGNINYVVEDQNGGSLPFTISVTYNSVTSLWEITTSTTDSSLVNVYQLQIHARFASPPLSGAASDNTQAKFQLILDYPNQCIHLNCTKNQINMIRFGYVEPTDITIDVSFNWNQTIFDNYNDTKTSACWLQPGSDINDVAVSSWGRPVCGYPEYDVVDTTGTPITNRFGIPNVLVQYYQDTEFTQQFIVKVRTDIKALAGMHKVRLSVKLTTESIVQYSQPFYIIVVDPCNPYDCTITQFIPGSPKPTNIKIAVGQGFVSSQQGLWSNTVSNQCKTTTTLCGQPQFELLLADLSPVPFEYTINQNANSISVNVIITDETMKGKTYDVVVVGFGFDTFSQFYYGQNGTSLPFKVIVADEAVVNPNAVSTNAPPSFISFPPNLSFVTHESTQYLHYTAIAFSKNSTIAEISITVNNAVLLVDYTIDGDSVAFDLSLLNTTSPGTYRVDVKATDLNGMFVKKSFTITAILLVTEKIVIESQTVVNITNPLTASITEITSVGLLTITYNRRVIPVTSLQEIRPQDFYLQFEQLSSELPIDFNYTVVDMTPDNVFVQLGFSAPLDVSQGVVPDNVFVYMLSSLFMVEDLDGIYDSWKPGDQIYNTTLPLNRTKLRNYGVYTNKTMYYPLQSPIPKQLGDQDLIQSLQSSVNYFSIALQVIMWGSFGMHLIGFGSMEYVWIMFTNLQIISTFSSLKLQMPLNLIAITESYSEITNSIFMPINKLYESYKYYASDSEDQTKNLYGQPIFSKSHSTFYKADYNDQDEDSRRLQSFEKSTFINKGASDLVILTSAQMIMLLVCLFILYIIGVFIKKTCYDYVSENLQNAFEYVRHRIFWNLPLRMFIQQYQCITFAALLNLKFRENTGSTELKVNYIFSIIVLSLYSIGFIVFSTVFILKYRFQLPFWKKQCDALFRSVKTDQRWASLSVCFGLLRKLLLILAAVTLEISSLQLYAATLIQLSYSFYVLLVKPMETRERNFVEIVNELILLAIITLMFTLTDFVTQSSIKYYNGWIIIYMMIFQICFNGFFLIVDLIWNIKRFIKVIKYQLFMIKSKRQVVNHNKTVDELTKVAKAEQYKIEIPLFTTKVEGGKSASSYSQESCSAVENIEYNQKIEPLTILEKKAEFQRKMATLRATDLQDNDGDREWVVSAHREKKQEGEWNYVQNISNASDWYALPRDYVNSQMINSVSLFSEHEQSVQTPVGIHNVLERSFEVDEAL